MEQVLVRKDGHGMMKSEKFSRGFAPRCRIEYCFCQDGHGVVNVDFFRQIFQEFRARVVATAVGSPSVDLLKFG